MQALSRESPIWRRGDDVEEFVRAVTAISLEPRQLGIFSAHQMGSCRMGPTRDLGANPAASCTTRGRLDRRRERLPDRSGTNPMFTVMSLARRTSARADG